MDRKFKDIFWNRKQEKTKPKRIINSVAGASEQSLYGILWYDFDRYTDSGDVLKMIK